MTYYAPLDEPAVNLGLRGWLSTPDDPFLAALHPALSCLAIARGACLAILPVSPAAEAAARRGGSGAGSKGRVRRFGTDITCLAWAAVLKSSGTSRSASAGGGASLGRSRLRAAATPSPPQARSGAASSAAERSDGATPQAAAGLLEQVVLLSGTANGCLQLHDAATGQLRFRQQLHTSAVASLHVRPCCSGLRPDEAMEDLTVCFADALVRITTVELATLMRLLQLQAGPHPASVPQLNTQRWELPAGTGPRRCALGMGFTPADLYSVLNGSSRPAHKLCLVTAGERPALASFQVQEDGAPSTLQYLTGAASSLASGVYGLARAATQQVVSSGGDALRQYGSAAVPRGVRSWLPSNPLAGLSLHGRHGYGSGEEGDESGADSGDDEGGVTPGVQCYVDPRQLPKAQPAPAWRVFRDDTRVVTELAPAPVGALVAAADSLGRVCVFDAGGLTLLRMWKGYREAQCGWLVPPEGAATAASGGLLMVLYAPRRQVLELWAPRGGHRVAAAHLPQPCRLLQVQQPYHSWNNAVAGEWGAACPLTTYVLETDSGRLWDAAAVLTGSAASGARC